MSGGTAKTLMAQKIENESGKQADTMAAYVLSQLGAVTNVLGSGTSWNSIPAEVKAGFDTAREDTKTAFRNAEFSSAEANRYLARTSGQDISQGQLQSAIARDARNLDQSRRFTLGQLDLNEANTAMSANNNLLRIFNGAGSTALGLSTSYQNQALQAASMMKDTNPWGSAMGGAASGASLGSVAGPWGALIGGVAGGAAGYFAG